MEAGLLEWTQKFGMEGTHTKKNDLKILKLKGGTNQIFLKITIPKEGP